MDEVRKVIEAHGYRRVLVLLPAGLMPKAEKVPIPEPVFSAAPCYGACDVPLHMLKDYDAIFNFGHSDPGGFPDNVHFFEVQIDAKSRFVPPFKRVGLVYAVQYKEAVKEYARMLEGREREVVLGGNPGFMATHKGQVTGCDVGAARAILGQVDGFVVAADGVFHASAVAALGKPAYNWEGRKAGAPEYPLAALFASNTVGILVGAKPGQALWEDAEEAQKKLEDMGKEVLMVVGDTITADIRNLPVDFWVVAACPRMAEDDHLKPAAPVKEVLISISGSKTSLRRSVQKT